MKILIVSTADISGGAARAAYRLHKSLHDKRVFSVMLVQDKKSDNFNVISENNKLKKIFNRLRPLLDSIPIRFYKRRTKTLFSSSWITSSNLVKKINSLNPDIVHLHWICNGMIKIEDISKIQAPIIWNLQDMWPFTGGCHYDEECSGYKNNCGNCKVLGSTTQYDLSRLNFNRKELSFSKIKNLTVVGVSNWVGRCASESSLFKNRNIKIIPNCVNTKLFREIDKKIARDFFEIPKDKKIILFGAMNALGDPRKGFEPLFNALSLLNIENVEFVVAGSSEPKNPIKLKYKVHYISPLEDEVSLPLMYNVADVMIVPSIQENLANSIIESLSCGVPVVAFDIGGNSDMIDHKINGYLAQPYSSEDLALGIEWVLSQKDNELNLNARKKALNSYEGRVVVERYKALYEEVIKGRIEDDKI